MKVALAGNPNSGKTTLFNELTGSSQYVGNWPGVTVEKKEGKLKSNKSIIIQDLPGIYSLSPYTPEEVITRQYLVSDKPDCIINIVDASNIERNLYLTTQLMETGLPIVIALNMMDIIRKNQDKIDVKGLSERLGLPVVEISALKNDGLKALIDKVEETTDARKVPDYIRFSNETEGCLKELEGLIKDYAKNNSRWYAIKLFERDNKALKELSLSESKINEINSSIEKVEKLHDDNSESIIISERYEYVTGLVAQTVVKKNKSHISVSDKIDRIVTNRILALPIFALIMFSVYFLSITSVGAMMTDWVNDVLFGEIIPGFIGGALDALKVSDWLRSLILDGIVGGVGAVLGFLPQMLVLFICLGILEDCGYMARIAFIMDKIFRRFGLSGKSFIPILIGTGCGVPGIMASRTIDSESDRRMTIITTTFIPCGAKLPIIALIAGALFSDSIWVAPSAYFIGIAAIIVSGIILKKTKSFSGDPAPYVMELPPYRMPGIKSLSAHVWERLRSFVVKAGTIILVACVAVWFLSNFGWDFKMTEIESSMLASIGGSIAWVFTPLGWGDWRSTVASFTGLIAKENVVSILGVLHGIGEVSESGSELYSALAGSMSALAAYSFLVFNLLCAPCFAAIGAVRREMNSFKWTTFAIAYQTIFAYLCSFMIYQIGLMFTGVFTVATVCALLIVVVFVYLIVRKPKERVQGFQKKLVKAV